MHSIFFLMVRLHKWRYNTKSIVLIGFKKYKSWLPKVTQKQFKWIFCLMRPLRWGICSNDLATLFDYLNYCYLNLKLNLSYWSTWKFISKIEFFYQIKIKICLFISILPLVSNSSSNSLDLCPTTREAKTCQVYFYGNSQWYHLFYFKRACSLVTELT